MGLKSGFFLYNLPQSKGRVYLLIQNDILIIISPGGMTRKDKRMNKKDKIMIQNDEEIVFYNREMNINDRVIIIQRRVMKPNDEEMFILLK